MQVEAAVDDADAAALPREQQHAALHGGGIDGIDDTDDAPFDDELEEEDDDDDTAGGSSDDEFNQRQFGIYQALPVGDGEPDWSQAEPDSAEEYLRRVRHEAARCPKVVRAEPPPPLEEEEEEDDDDDDGDGGGVDNGDDGGGDAGMDQCGAAAAGAAGGGGPPPPPAAAGAAAAGKGGRGAGRRPRRARAFVLAQPQAIAAAPAWAKPDRAWVVQFASDFQALRRHVAECFESGAYPAYDVPHVNDEQGWDRLCFGGAAQADADAAEAVAAAAEAASGAGAGAGAAVTNLMPRIAGAIMALEQPDVATLFLRHAQQLDDACRGGRLPLLRAQWLFALAARLEKPCHPEVGAAFRAVLRHCARLRAAAASPAAPELPPLNVLIAVAGAYFAQDEELCGVVDASELP